MREVILLFHIPDKQQLKKIELALLPLRVRLRLVKPEEYNQPLGFLAGIKELPAAKDVYTGEDLPSPMFVFAFFSNTRLNQVLDALRRCGAGPFPYKAILTPTNQFWNAQKCFQEICHEHETMRG